MEERIKKPNSSSRYYVWQTDAYGQSFYYADRPCQIFSYRPMPCTPSGDLVADVPTARQALQIVECLSLMDLASAKAYVTEALAA